MSKTKYFFIMILYGLLINGAASIQAQTGTKATKADVAGMIEFYELGF